MRTAYIVGVNSRLKKQLVKAIGDAALPLLPDWEIKFFLIEESSPQIPISILPKLFTEVERQTHPHLLCFSKQDGKVRQEISNRIKSFYRFRWLDNNLLAAANSSPLFFAEQINEVLRQEAEWGRLVQPQTNQSPLLVPECCFDAGATVRDMWAFATRYGDIANVHSAAALARKFADLHWCKRPERGHYKAKYKWLDEGNLEFDSEGEKHAKAETPWNRKFSFSISSGFHFDVSHGSGAAFTISDGAGKKNKCERDQYLNVDAHGFVSH